VNIWSDGAMTIRQAEKFSGISRSRLYLTMKRGALVWTGFGGTRLISRRSLIELLAKGVPADPAPQEADRD
jgi:hypothetical protein